MDTSIQDLPAELLSAIFVRARCCQGGLALLCQNFLAACLIIKNSPRLVMDILTPPCATTGADILVAYEQAVSPHSRTTDVLKKSSALWAEFMEIVACALAKYYPVYSEELVRVIATYGGVTILKTLVQTHNEKWGYYPHTWSRLLEILLIAVDNGHFTVAQFLLWRFLQTRFFCPEDIPTRDLLATVLGLHSDSSNQQLLQQLVNKNPSALGIIIAMRVAIGTGNDAAAELLARQIGRGIQSTDLSNAAARGLAGTVRFLINRAKGIRSDQLLWTCRERMRQNAHRWKIDELFSALRHAVRAGERDTASILFDWRAETNIGVTSIIDDDPGRIMVLMRDAAEAGQVSMLQGLMQRAARLGGRSSL